MARRGQPLRRVAIWKITESEIVRAASKATLLITAIGLVVVSIFSMLCMIWLAISALHRG